MTTKRIAATIASIALVTPFIALAQSNVINTYDTLIPRAFGLGTNTDLRGAIIRVIQILLGFLGLLAVLIVLYGGYLWMTSAGNEDRVRDARATLTAGAIGTLIILSAYALTKFVTNFIINAVTR